MTAPRLEYDPLYDEAYARAGLLRGIWSGCLLTAIVFAAAAGIWGVAARLAGR